MIEDQPGPGAIPRSYRIGVNLENEVLIDFGVPVRYVRLGKEEAQVLAQHILRHAERLKENTKCEK